MAAKAPKESPAWAVVCLGGSQYLVKSGDELTVNRLEGDEKKAFPLEDTLLFFDGKKLHIGQPKVSKVKVTAETLSQEKGKKIEVRRFKAKSRYRRKRGHRQALTRIKILEVGSKR